LRAGVAAVKFEEKRWEHFNFCVKIFKIKNKFLILKKIGFKKCFKMNNIFIN
jgi:hypothetical protein